jgi:hypothetical protein
MQTRFSKTSKLFTLCLIGLPIAATGCKQQPKSTSDGVQVTAEDPRPTHVPPYQRTPKATTQPEPTPPIHNRVRYRMCANGLPRDLSWKCDPILADVNKDGFMDLAANPRLGKGPRVWLGDGKGNWKDASSGLDHGMGSCGGGLAFADLNGDGHLDLAVGDHCQGVFVYLGDGGNHWQLVTKALFPFDLAADAKGVIDQYAGAEDLDVGDFNHDGFIDLIVSSSDNGGINIYFGDGTGINWRRADGTDLPHLSWANRVVTADINKDGWDDVVASMGEGLRVWINNKQGQFVASQNGLPGPLLQGLYQGVAVGDINKDGLPDIAVANWIYGPEVYLQQTGGSWKKAPMVFERMEGGSYGIALGDLDKDGHLDIVVTGRLDKGDKGVGFVRGVFALLGDGTGKFTYAHGSGLADTGMSFNWGTVLGDVNNDGLLDVVVGSGGVVETVPGRNEPLIPERLAVWCAQSIVGSGRMPSE